MTTPKVRAAWPIGFTPADLQRAQAGPRGPQDPVTISTGNVIGVYDDDPGEGTWHYRIGYPSQASPPVYGPWAAILVEAAEVEFVTAPCSARPTAPGYAFVDDAGTAWYMYHATALALNPLSAITSTTAARLAYNASGIGGKTLYANGESIATMPATWEGFSNVSQFTIKQRYEGACVPVGWSGGQTASRPVAVLSTSYSGDPNPVLTFTAASDTIDSLGGCG